MRNTTTSAKTPARAFARRPMLRLLHFLRRVSRKFILDEGLLRASALAFTSALGVVPLLALVVLALSFFGIGKQIEMLALTSLTGGNEEVMGRLTVYLGRVNLNALGWIGFGSLAVTGLLLLDGIETSFNVIWGVKQGRSLWRKIVVYPIFAVLCPVLLLLSGALTAIAQLSSFAPDFAWAGPFLPLFSLVGPLAAKATAFGALFFFLPYQRIRVIHALAGGVFAALLWHVAEWGFFRIGIGISRTHAIYGALAQLPSFLVWLYVCWCILLFAAEATCLLGAPPETDPVENPSESPEKSCPPDLPA